MSRLSLGRLAVGLLPLGVLLMALTQADRAEAQSGAERPKFDTFDSVELVGTFYPGLRGNKSPCAILLHAVGEHSQKEGWDELAKALQKEGFAVLTFDFRGHGDSTAVGQYFYVRESTNKTLKSFGSAKTKDKINYKDFTKIEHFQLLVNDIAAAKRFLDKKNDSGDCNSSSVVLIGAESGAALGAMYTYWAWQQPKMQIGVLGAPQVMGGQKEGQDIAGCVWLSMSESISPNANTGRVNVASWVRAAPIREKVPMYYLYGEKDTKAADVAKKLLANKPKSLKLTDKKGLPGTKLAGRELLGKGLETPELIVKYAKRVLDDRAGSVWTKREVERIPPIRIPIEKLR